MAAQIGLIKSTWAATRAAPTESKMSKSSKKEKPREPEKTAPKSKPSFGLIAIIFILGGIAVFALTRNKQYEPPAEQAPPPVQAQESSPPTTAAQCA